MVRELKKYKTYFQEKTNEQQSLFQKALTEFNEVAERLLVVDSDAEDIIKISQKIILRYTPKRSDFDKFRRALRDLEELWIDTKKSKKDKVLELFEENEKDMLCSADQELAKKIQERIDWVKQQTLVLKILLGE